jgi:hypothetical protein
MSQRHAMPSLLPAYGIEWSNAYEVTFICAGVPFNALVRARNQQAATEEAKIELAIQCPDFDPEKARLVRSVQTH